VEHHFVEAESTLKKLESEKTRGAQKSDSHPRQKGGGK